MRPIGVIIPSRGLIFAEVIKSLTKELDGIGLGVKFYVSHDLKIPECENELVEQALADTCNLLLFIEEDTVIPRGGLQNLINAHADIACIDYGVAGYSCITKDDETGEILWCGLGCTLVKREVFEALEKPYFRSDKQLLLNFWPEIRWIDAPKDAYGGQDIWFCMHAREKGFKIVQAPGECKHLKLDELGKPGINNGLHKISQKPIISKYQTL